MAAASSEALCHCDDAWAGVGWTDSSWELARGLEVVEGLSLDDWHIDPWHEPTPMFQAPQKE